MVLESKFSESGMSDEILIVFPIYENVTPLDFLGALHFFSKLSNSKIIVGSVGAMPIRVDAMVLSGLADLAALSACDILCVPGGSGCANAMEDIVFMNTVRRLGEGAQYITSVCTGSLILGAAGLLSGRKATSHWAWSDMLPEFGAIPETGRVVRDGNIFTGGGVTAGMDLALTVIGEIAGPHAAQAIQLGAEYAPSPPFAAGTPDTASADVLEVVLSKLTPESANRRAQIKLVAKRLFLNVDSRK